MNTPHAHRFNSSALERQSDSSAPPRPPPRPGRSWLPFVGVGAALLLLRTLGARGKSTHAHAFSYSAFLSQVQSNPIRSAVINPAGAVSGTLTNGTGYTSQIPAALPDPQLPGLLRAHHVAITGVGPQTSIGAVIVSLCVDRTPWSAPGHWRNQGHRRVQGQALRRRASVSGLCRCCRL